MEKTACKAIDDFLDKTSEQEIEEQYTCKNCGVELNDYSVWQKCSACGNIHNMEGEEL
jgi:rubrerythrin